MHTLTLWHINDGVTVSKVSDEHGPHDCPDPYYRPEYRPGK